MLTPEMNAKAALRRDLLAARSELTTEQLSKAAHLLAGHLENLLLEVRPTTVAVYVPFGSEPGGPGMPGLVASLASKVIVPVLLPDKDLAWTGLDGGERLAPQAISQAELIIVPALAVDVTGYRLGRGGGSYDRALSRASSSALLVALLHDGEILAQVPHEPHDRKVHRALTPIGVTKLDR
ncbi:5-formyltetrahydrofolate cyclo-ligase [Rhizocola hellebori]|uniref:5-formyltetrahydrofolate cyclo-ligase n=1 Tax=Rhizocola hellebori TaxID=1392758 RepID=A0A8J3VJV6_9ACTN|nr:5-formyltetrahydrofolate cyclo-ligase [Rhizocola hellebori]GIH09115.1 5-formyltetrahydrofolate cyclo-ligase [Rhizocola hellebori]